MTGLKFSLAHNRQFEPYNVWGKDFTTVWNLKIYNNLYGKPRNRDWVVRVSFPTQILLIFGGRCNRCNMFFQFLLTSKANCFLVYRKLIITNHLCSHWWIFRLSIGLDASRKGKIVTGYKINDKGLKNIFKHIPATRRKYFVCFSCFSCHFIFSLRFLKRCWSKVNIGSSILLRRSWAWA